MRHDNIRTVARNLALDRDGAVISADLAMILNDNATWIASMNTDRAAYLTATSAGFSVADTTFSSRITATNILRVLSVTREASASTIDGTPVDIVSPADIYYMRSKSTAVGTPHSIALVRLAGSSNRMRAICHPPSSGGHSFSVHYLPFPPEFTLSPIADTEVLDLPQHAQYLVARETAYDLACILRRPDATLEAIQGRFEDAQKLHDTMLRRNLAPTPPTDKPR